MTGAMLYITTGLALGFTAGIAPGPLTALVVSHTLRYGVGAGIKIASAPIITDLPIIGATLLLMVSLPNAPWPIGLISLIGGGYLGYLAWSSFTLTAAEPEAKQNDGDSFKKGALVNLLNPHPYLFWLTIGTPMMLKKWHTDPWASAIWILGFYIALIGSKIAIAIIVGPSRKWINSRGHLWLNRVMGLFLVLFAGVFIRDGLRLIGLLD